MYPPRRGARPGRRRPATTAKREKVLELLNDGCEHSTWEVARLLGGPNHDLENPHSVAHARRLLMEMACDNLVTRDRPKGSPSYWRIVRPPGSSPIRAQFDALARRFGPLDIYPPAE